MRNILLLAMLMGICPVLFGSGFFEVLYSGSVAQEADLDALEKAGSYGFTFGYDTKLFSSDVFIDIEFGYEMSTHKLEPPLDNSDYFFRNHRGFFGVRVKYGGLGYVEPYIGSGVIVYGYYEASDPLSGPPEDFPDFEIAKNMSGSYLVYGVDFYFSQGGNFSLGLEQRIFKFRVKDTNDGSLELDVEIRRLAFKISVLF